MTKPSATLIGAFVLGSIALIVAGVLFFGRGSFADQHIPMVSFFYRSMAGLRVGAPVTFRGVRVGEVRSMGIRVNPGTDNYIIREPFCLVDTPGNQRRAGPMKQQASGPLGEKKNLYYAEVPPELMGEIWPDRVLKTI